MRWPAGMNPELADKWLAEVLAEMPEPTVRQLDTVAAEFRKVALTERIATAA